jgi:RNA polymerase sigma-70 factor (ECF subfamily)
MSSVYFGCEGAKLKSMMQAPRYPDEAHLIRRAQNGDSAALEILFSRHQPALYRTALRVLGNEADAQDALQDGLLSAYRNLGRFERRSQFSSWLTRIVINAALMRLRRQRGHETVSIDDEQGDSDMRLADVLPHPGPGPEDVYAGAQLRDRVADQLDEMSPALRSAFLLRFARGLTNEEVARVLGISELAVKTRVHRARTELAEKLRNLLRPARALQPATAI